MRYKKGFIGKVLILLFIAVLLILLFWAVQSGYDLIGGLKQIYHMVIG
jgi:hypothetical protein